MKTIENNSHQSTQDQDISVRFMHSLFGCKQ